MNLSVAYNDFAITLQKSGYIDEAEKNYRKALELDAANMAAWSNIGTCLSGKGLHTEALEAYEKAIELDPTLSAAHSNISVIYADRGENEKAVSALRKALELQPDFAVAHSNLICQLDLSVTETTASLQAERKKWAKQHTANIQRMPPAKHKNAKIRIGYVSADFRQHSAAYAFGAMLKDFDREAFEVYCYYNHPIYDPTSEQFEGYATKWRDVVHMTDDDLAGQIRHDQIDILVDLSGHSAGNRLLAFARKPANVQITAWGYLGGTGLDEMDYMLADPVIIPKSERHLYAEKILDLPSAINICFRAPFPDSEFRDGEFTFGSFNRLPKVTAEMFNAWGDIMTAVPHAKLLMKTPELDDEGTRDKIIAQLKAVGIDQRRVRMMGRSKWEQHVAAFNLVDVCLDSFPHGGGITTAECLMMGVPVVSLNWPTVAGRVSASILHAAGMKNWLASDLKSYVDIAKAAALDRAGLKALKIALRDWMEASPVCDAKTTVGAVEAIYKKLIPR